MSFNIRWMIRRDLDAVLAIENESFEFPWAETDYLKVMGERHCNGLVAEDAGGNIVGLIVYELHKNRIDILNLAVAHKARRLGVGRAMIAKLVARLDGQPRNQLTADIRERNVLAQVFFRELGFRYILTKSHFYEDTDEDCYTMQYRVESSVPV